jgi:hypothetical protein
MCSLLSAEDFSITKVSFSFVPLSICAWISLGDLSTKLVLHSSNRKEMSRKTITKKHKSQVSELLNLTSLSNLSVSSYPPPCCLLFVVGAFFLKVEEVCAFFFLFAKETKSQAFFGGGGVQQIEEEQWWKFQAMKYR